MELIVRENVQLSKKQVNEIIELIGKEEAIKQENDEKAAEELAVQEKVTKLKDSKENGQPALKNLPIVTDESSGIISDNKKTTIIIPETKTTSSIEPTKAQPKVPLTAQTSIPKEDQKQP